MSSQYFWPFAQNPTGAIPQVITYDLVIQDSFPGIDFEPTIAGGTYAEIRDVYNCLWFVTNAMWNPNTLQWEQDAPANCALPCYAIELCQDGSFSYKIAPATGAINTAVTWQTVWTLDADGNMTVEPAAATAQGIVAEQVNPTWNAGAGASMVAREINVTDTSSATDSYLDQLSVDGTIKWQVRKDGTLTVGIIPASLVPGAIDSLSGTAPVSVSVSGHIATVGLTHGDYVDLTNAQTIEGPKTIADALSLFFGATSGAEGSVVASNIFGGIAYAYGAKYTGSAFTWQAEATTAIILELTPAGGLTLYYNAGLTVGDTYAPTQIFNIDNAGGTGNSLLSSFEGTDGVEVSFDAGTSKIDISGIGLVATIESSDGSILATLSPAQTYDLTLNPAHNLPGASLFTAGGGSGGTVAGGMSITLPGVAGDEFDVVLIFNFNGNSNNNSSITIATTAGTITQVTNTGDGTVSQNASYYSIAMYVGTAAGAQTITFESTIAGVSFGTYGWVIQATKI